VLFGTAFVLKHLLLAGFYGSPGGWWKRVAALALEGVSLGTIDLPAYAPATGYISFFTLALYVAGLVLLTPKPAEPMQPNQQTLLEGNSRLPNRQLQERESVPELRDEQIEVKDQQFDSPQ
jgi:hypothetical protein